MSSVAFNTMSDTVFVGGAERAWASQLCRQMMDGVLDFASFPAGGDSTLVRLMKMVRPDGVMSRMADPGLLSSMIHHGRETLVWNGHAVDAFSLALNTAIVLGSDPMRFSARMHGQCEIHGWVAGRNRWWLSDIIEEGQESGVLRKAYQTQYENWPGVVTMLRDESQTPVVMSYSVCESFPSAGLAVPASKPYNTMTEADRLAREHEVKAWHALDYHVKWNQAFAALQSQPSLEMRPDAWKQFRFGHNLSALDILANDWMKRFDRAFPVADDESDNAAGDR